MLSVNFAPSESVPRGSQAALSTPARAVSTPTAPAVRSRHLGQFPMAHRPSIPRARLAGPAFAGRPASRPCPKRHVQSRAAFLRPSESLQVRGPPHAHLTSERVTDLRLPYLPGRACNRTKRPPPRRRAPIPTQASASAAGATALAKKSQCACNAMALKNLGDLGNADAFVAANRARYFWTTLHPPRWSAPTVIGAQLFGGSAATMHPLAPPWRRWRRPSTSISQRRAGNRTLGRTTGGRCGWLSPEPWHAGPELADQAGMEVGPDTPPAFPAATSALRGQPVRVVGQDVGLGARTANGVQAADSEGHSALAACMAAHVDGGAPCAPANTRGDTGVHAGKRGRSSGGVQPVVHLASYGVPCFEGTCSVHIDRLMNDTVRKGLPSTRPLAGSRA
jgi:hypothetical protein